MAKTLDELLAEVGTLTGDRATLTPGATVPANLVSAANSIFSITGERDAARTSLAAEQGRVSALTGDKSKLVAGATLPTDLVTAGNEIAGLKATAKSVDEKVASKIAELGLTDKTPTAAAAATTAKALTLDEKILAARGCKTYAELNSKMEARRKQQESLG